MKKGSALFFEINPPSLPSPPFLSLVAEIHSTEEFYISSLLEMIEGYKKPLISCSRRPGSTIKEDDMAKMFGNVETILK